MYSNIFQYYRGQSKSETNVPMKQNENNTKKAFINLLEHSNPLLTRNFIKKFTDQEIIEGTAYYNYETTRKMKPTKLGYVICIAETKEYDDIGINFDSTRPDATIYIESQIAIVFEFKILDGKLNSSQINGHAEYLDSEMTFKPIEIEWKIIRDFLKNQHQLFLNQNDSVTCFLLDQFDRYCNFNSIGLIRYSNEYYYTRFKTDKAQSLAKNINDYLLLECEYKNDMEDYHLAINKPRTDCLGYKSCGHRYKIFTLTEARNVCLVLHLGKKYENLVEELQTRVNNDFNQDLVRDGIGKSPTTTEVYIKLELVNEFNQIKPYLDEVYRLRTSK